jgi:glycosyltransferase involved in cell wall biosynthesis
LEEARAAGVWKPAWTAIPNFIDTNQFKPGETALRAELGIPADALVVLTAAAIKRGHKRIDYLIEEFARLRQERPELPAYLIVAGGWETETDELVRWGKEILGDRVRFLVRFPRERMPELYRAADVFALCSLKEMMPIALLEATASGLPCLVNAHPVLSWMIGNGGQAIDMAAPGALSRALASLLSDRATCRATGAAAREYCVQNFGRDHVVDQIVDYYGRVLADRRSGKTAAPQGEP